MSGVDHNTYVRPTFNYLLDAHLWSAECSCGWRSDKRYSVEHVATGEADEHRTTALDAARAQQSPATIHPPAHYQIDTSTPGWNTRYVDAVAKEHGWTRAEAQGRIADGGAT